MFLKGIKWVKPGCIKGVLSSWVEDGKATEMEDCPSTYMVGSLDRKERGVLRMREKLAEDQNELFNTLFAFQNELFSTFLLLV